MTTFNKAVRNAGAAFHQMLMGGVRSLTVVIGIYGS